MNIVLFKLNNNIQVWAGGPDPQLQFPGKAGKPVMEDSDLTALSNPQIPIHLNREDYT